MHCEDTASGIVHEYLPSLAVEEALRIKEQVGSGTVTVITLDTEVS